MVQQAESSQAETLHHLISDMVSRHCAIVHEQLQHRRQQMQLAGAVNQHPARYAPAAALLRSVAAESAARALGTLERGGTTAYVSAI